MDQQSFQFVPVPDTTRGESHDPYNFTFFKEDKTPDDRQKEVEHEIK